MAVVPPPRPPVVAAMVVAALAALTTVATPVRIDAAPAAAADRPPIYRPPTEAPVVDPYRPPTRPYGPGNRGLDYGTAPGDPLGAIADGVVGFAGQVGGALFVTVRHDDPRFPDGLRSTLARVGSIVVVAGEPVVRGQLLARAAGPTHLGVRHGRVYLDPSTLFRPLRPVARLVPLPSSARIRAAPR